MKSEVRNPKSEVGRGDSLAYALRLWPLPVIVVFTLWPCLGVTLAVGETAFTLALVVSDLDELMRRKRFTL